MRYRSFARLSSLVTVFGLVFTLLAAQAQNAPKRGRKYKAPPLTARIEVTILRDGSNKPVENAAVVFHPMEGERDKGNMELKTNDEGKMVIDVIPIGDTVRMQVIAKGFQTFGQDFKVDKEEMSFVVKLKRPGQQYSIYKDHPGTSDADTKPDASKAPDGDKPKDGTAPQPK